MMCGHLWWKLGNGVGLELPLPARKAKESAAAAALLSLTGGEQDEERMELLKVVKKLLD